MGHCASDERHQKSQTGDYVHGAYDLCSAIHAQVDTQPQATQQEEEAGEERGVCEASFHRAIVPVNKGGRLSGTREVGGRDDGSLQWQWRWSLAGVAVGQGHGDIDITRLDIQEQERTLAVELVGNARRRTC